MLKDLRERVWKRIPGLAGRVLTGSVAFGVAGATDVAMVIWALARLRLGDRSDRLLRESVERQLRGE